MQLSRELGGADSSVFSKGRGVPRFRPLLPSPMAVLAAADLASPERDEAETTLG